MVLARESDKAVVPANITTDAGETSAEGYTRGGRFLQIFIARRHYLRVIHHLLPVTSGFYVVSSEYLSEFCQFLRVRSEFLLVRLDKSPGLQNLLYLI